MNTLFIMSYSIMTIGWLVLMTISNNKNRREIFPFIVAIPFAPIVVTVGLIFIGLFIVTILLFEIIPNYLFEDK